MIDLMELDVSEFSNLTAWIERLQEFEEVKQMDEWYKTYLVENKDLIQGWKDDVAKAINE